jgi:hypothetical protein
MSKKKRTERGELTVFAEAIGCKRGLEPIPHDQIETLLDERYKPWLRVLACLWLHQFPKYHRARFIKEGREGGFFSIGKPHTTCCNKCKGRTGMPVQPQHVGNHLGMDDGNVRRTLEFLESEKRIVWEREKKITVVGDFALPAAALSPDVPLDQSTEKVCTDLWADYLVKQINNLDLPTIGQLISAEKSRVKKFETLQADFAAAIRAIADEEQDTMLAAVGVKVRRQTHTMTDAEKEAEAEARRKRLESLVPELRKFVQTFGEKSLNRPEKEFVQSSETAPSSMFTGVQGTATEVEPLKGGGARIRKVVEDREQSSSSSEKTTTTESPDPVHDAARTYTAVDDPGLDALKRACRKVAPSCTPHEIAYAIHAKGPLAAKKDNPFGFLLTAVPRYIASNLRDIRKDLAVAAGVMRSVVHEETREMKIERLEGEIETREKIANDKMHPPAERENQKALATEARKQLAAIKGKADAVGGGA